MATSKSRSVKVKAASRNRVSPSKRVRPATKRTGRRASSKPASKSSSKQEIVLSMLGHASGATVAAITAATGWQPHSVRGFFAGVVKKKLKLTLDSEKVGKDRIYRIAKPSASS